MAQDNKKVYTIVINGVKESIESIDALKSKLDALEDRIEALNKKGVTNPIGNGASSEMDEITRKAAAAVEEYRKTNQELNKTKNILGEIAKDKEKLASIDVGVSSKETSKMVPLGSVDSSKTKGEPTYVQGKGFMVEMKDAENVSSTMKEIEKTEKRIADARGEEYQSLLAAKEQLNEVKNIQSQIAAKERLFNDQYDLNTLDGINAKLKDIKTVTNTVDIDSDMFSSLVKSANDLNTKLKQVKESMGQSERNVGNYKSALDGAADVNEKIRISVNGQIKEYNNVRQALKSLSNEIMNLSVNGKENTQEFEELGKTYHEFYMATLRAKSAVSDLQASSKGMDAMFDAFTSLSAIGQIGGGLQGLFGIDGIDETIQKLMSLQSIVSGLEQIKQQLNTGEFLGGYFNKASDSIDKFVNKLFGIKDTSDKVKDVVGNVAEGMEQEAKASKTASTALKTQEATTVGVTVATKAATIAAKTFKIALASIGIGLLIAAVSWAIDAIGNFVQSMDSSEAQLNEFNAACKASEQAYKSLGDTLNSDYMSGKISQSEYAAKSMENENKYIKEQIKLLKERSKRAGSDAGIDFTTTSNKGTSPMVNAKNIDETKKKFLELTDAVNEGQDYFEKYEKGFSGWMNSFFTSVNATEEEANKKGGQILGDFVNQVEKIDLTAPDAEEQIKKLYAQFGKDEALQRAIAKMKEIIPKDEIREGTQFAVDRFKWMVEQINASAERTAQHWINAEPDPYIRQKKQIKYNMKNDLKGVKKDSEEEKSIKADYARQLSDLEKQHNDDIAAKNKQAAENARRLKEENNRKLLTADKELYNAELTMMEDGLAKQLKTIRKSYEERIMAAKENGAKVN